MADSESINTHPATSVLQAENLTSDCYETLLELSSIVDGFRDMQPPPAWAFGISRMVDRARDLVDRANAKILSIPGSTVTPHPAPMEMRGPASGETGPGVQGA